MILQAPTIAQLAEQIERISSTDGAAAENRASSQIAGLVRAGFKPESALSRDVQHVKGSAKILLHP
jgi:hypothetical protein